MLVETDDLISIPEAAEARGVTRAWLWKMATRGTLQTVKIGTCLFLYKREVEALERKPAGRPKGTKKGDTQDAATIGA